jgi:hypothetical protein
MKVFDASIRFDEDPAKPFVLDSNMELLPQSTSKALELSISENSATVKSFKFARNV